MTQNNANNRVVNELLKPLKKRSGAMIGWGIFCIVLGTIGLFAPIAFSVGVTIFIGAMLLVSGATGLALFWKAEGWGARTAAIILALLSRFNRSASDVLSELPELKHSRSSWPLISSPSVWLSAGQPYLTRMQKAGV